MTSVPISVRNILGDAIPPEVFTATCIRVIFAESALRQMNRTLKRSIIITACYLKVMRDRGRGLLPRSVGVMGRTIREVRGQ
jgi:hypothetical protein